MARVDGDLRCCGARARIRALIRLDGGPQGCGKAGPRRALCAGARSVSLDIIFSAPSSYGEADDQRFTQSLQQYADRVVLAAEYSEVETPQGFTTQLTLPLPLLQTGADQVGSINFLVEPDGKIHRFGNQFSSELIQNSPADEAKIYREWAATTPTFADATLQAAGVEYFPPEGNNIFFMGRVKHLSISRSGMR
ncbi:MAG: CHASE2 domain-containing protein [Leptolyngbyaceae cyanobacterium RM2_2_4]|nr:CHASE2 domain-containing protein [Leptolyngbyaceae cyanobacterium RM2_2_4]